MCVPQVGGSNPTRGKKVYAIFHTLCVVTTSNTIPPVYPAVMGTQHLLGCKFTGQASCISYGYRWDLGCSHSQAERCGQYSCELLARLQEFACTGLISLLSAQASWLCQVRVTAQRQQENLHFFAFCDCVDLGTSTLLMDYVNIHVLSCLIYMYYVQHHSYCGLFLDEHASVVMHHKTPYT